MRIAMSAQKELCSEEQGQVKHRIKVVRGELEAIRERITLKKLLLKKEKLLEEERELDRRLEKKPPEEPSVEVAPKEEKEALEEKYCNLTWVPRSEAEQRKVELLSGGSLDLLGTLTLKGSTCPLTLPRWTEFRSQKDFRWSLEEEHYYLVSLKYGYSLGDIAYFSSRPVDEVKEQMHRFVNYLSSNVPFSNKEIGNRFHLSEEEVVKYRKKA